MPHSFLKNRPDPFGTPCTSVDAGLKSKTFGFCNEFCEKKYTQRKSDEDITTLVVGISSAILILSSIVIIYYCYVKRKKDQGKGNEDTIIDGNMAMINSSMILNEQAEHLSYSGEYEIERSKFEIGRKLGGGSYGSVHESIAEDPTQPGQMNKVAVKSVKNPLDPAQIYALICEIKVLDKLEYHLNLVNMVGACTTEFKSGKIWLLLEYCPHGDMKNFLLRNRDIITQGLHCQRVPHENLNIRLFLKWSHSICKGMEYLASKNIMHGDLAARNILITNSNNGENYLAKIADFGLSKHFYDKTSYVKQDRKNLPGKGMDVDFYETNVLRLSSDVWSFGVVFWEMLSIGRFPYAGGDADDTIKKIKAGYRLPVPDEVKEANWLAKCYNEVTEMCWQLDPKQRCNFSDLVKIFKNLLTTEEKEVYKQMEQNITIHEAKHELSNAFAMSMNDVEVIYTNPIHETIEMEYIDPVEVPLSDQTT